MFTKILTFLKPTENFRITTVLTSQKKEVFANETPAQYKAATPSGYFIGFRRTLSKADMDTIAVPTKNSILSIVR